LQTVDYRQALLPLTLFSGKVSLKLQLPLKPAAFRELYARREDEAAFEEWVKAIWMTPEKFMATDVAFSYMTHKGRCVPCK
jgi:hypothetical protein